MNKHRLLNILQVQQLTGLSRSTLWREERAGRFPYRVRITENRIGWEEAEVLTWIEGKLQGRSGSRTFVENQRGVAGN